MENFDLLVEHLNENNGPEIPEEFHDTYWVKAAKYMSQNYWVIHIAVILYVALIFGIKHLMKDRKPFQLKVPLFLWNCCLATFSFLGMIFVAQSEFYSIRERGLQADLCGVEAELQNPWVFLFCISKIPEFIDTIFIVLRKSNLIFLHWYHHIATAYYCWSAWCLHTENGGLFALMNLTVHSIMYSYYAATATGKRFGPFIRQSITTLQIIQMVGGILICSYNIRYCNLHPLNLYACLAMYISYFYLFARLYRNSYLRKAKTNNTSSTPTKKFKKVQ